MNSVAMLAGDASVELRNDLLPASGDQPLVAQVGGGGQVGAAVEPDIRLGAVTRISSEPSTDS